jgi:Family of unknown function (DUF6932)
MGQHQSHRDQLLGAGAEFVRFAKQIHGVQRIGLIGSMCAARSDPKDIDFVVEISDDVDWDGLAAQGRRLKGRAQQANRGADIFLVRDGRYIGRICHYRECFPRRACHALHCGETPHLNDDLTTLQLRREVFEAPAVTIWPDLQRRAKLPKDVEAFLAAFDWPANRPLQPTSGSES